LEGIGLASDDPGDLVMHHEGTARLVAALRALPDQDQRVIVLRQFERRSFEEVAELMGRPSRHAVGHLLSRARERLRRVLGL
jgi:RNA polymerase sigma factor (sigma-70 family)